MSRRLCGGVGGGLCDYCVSPSPFALDFGTLDLDFGLGLDNILHLSSRGLPGSMEFVSSLTVQHLMNV